MKISTFTPITKDESWILGLIPVPKNEAPVNVRRARHDIYVIDESGSMWNTLPKLIEDLKKQVRSLQVGDAVTFGWFSSEGMNGFPIKCFRIINYDSFVELDRLFDEHCRARSLTCFSESLGQIETILQESSFLRMKNCLTFFSDGFANDPGERSEKEKVREIMRSLNGKIDLVLTVAYGDYSDRAFLAEIAALAGGECISSAHLHDFSAQLHKFIQRAEISEPRMKVSLIDIPFEFVYSFDSNPETGGITTYTPDENSDLYFAPSKNINELFVLSGSVGYFERLVQQGGRIARIDLQKIIRNSFGQQNLIDGAYAASVVLSQNDKQDEAIDVLGYLGDKALVERLGSAYTPTERGTAESEIRSAVFHGECWKQGIDFGCVPAPDAFCILDLLQQLGNDDSARFYPRHPAFKYKKIGRGETTVEGYPKFIAEDNASSPLSDIVLHKEFLNLSIRVRVGGTIELPDVVVVDEKGKMNLEGLTALKRPDTLDKTFKTHQYRTYTIIKDGYLNVTRLPITCSAEVALKLQEKGVWVWTEENQLDNKPFSALHLDKLPVINKLIAEKTPTARSLANKVMEDEAIKARLKLLNAVRDELDPNKKFKKTPFSEPEQKFLAAVGIGSDGGYNPPTIQDEPTDQYEVTAFKTSVKGFSSLPTLLEVRERRDTVVAGKGKYTPAMLPMVAELEAFEDFTVRTPLEMKIGLLDDRIKELKADQRALRKEIQEPKFAMALGHKSFSDVEPTNEPIKIEVIPSFAGVDTLTATIQKTKAIVKI